MNLNLISRENVLILNCRVISVTAEKCRLDVVVHHGETFCTILQNLFCLVAIEAMQGSTKL